MQGTVESVFTEFIGSPVLSSSSGVTIIVENGSAFENASQVQISETIYSLVSVNENVLTIDSSVSVDAGEEIDVYPLTPERYAIVSADQGESIVARIPHSLDAFLLDGDRVETDRENVLLDQDSAGYFVKDVLNKRAALDAGILTGDIPIEVLQTKVKPDYSPKPNTRGGIGFVLVSWQPVENLSPVEYDVHVSTSPSFTPDASSLLITTMATMISFRAMPDGTVASYDQDYFFKIIARSGTLSADPSDETSGRLDQAGSADIIAGSVTAEKLASTIVLAGEIATAPVGSRVRLSANQGLEGFASDGSTVFHLPVIPDASGDLIASIRTDAVLRSATVEDRLSIRGTNNEIGKGAITTLATGTTAPQTSPSVSVGWPVKNTWAFSNRGYNPRGWFWDGAGWWQTTSLFGGGVNRWIDTGSQYALDVSFNLRANENPIGGVVVLGGKVYVLVDDSNRSGAWYVYRFTTAGVKEAEWKYSNFTGSRAALGVKGSNLLIAHGDTSGNLVRFKEYTTGGTLVGTVNTSYAAYSLAGVMFGSFDFGANRYVLATTTSSSVMVFNSSGDSVANDIFPTPGVTIDGIGHDGSNFYTTSGFFNVYKHSNMVWGSSGDLTRWVAHSWFDQNVGGTGQHETFISEPISFSAKKRAMFTVTTPPLPAADPVAPDDSVTGVRIYHGTGATKPGASSMLRESADIAAGAIVKTYETLNPTLPANTGTPSAFPASTPAQIKSSSGGLVIYGDGKLSVQAINSAGGNLQLGDASSTITIPGGLKVEKPVMWSGRRNTTARPGTSGADVVLGDLYTENYANGISRSGSTFTVNVAGWYRVSVRMTWDASSAGYRALDIRLGGTIVAEHRGPGSSSGAGSNAYTTHEVSYHAELAAGSQLTFYAMQTSGASQPVITGSAFGHLIIQRIA